MLKRIAYLAWEVLTGVYHRKRRALRTMQAATRDLPRETVQGVTTHGAKRLAQLDIDSANAAYGANYQTSNPGILRQILTDLALPYESFTFLDLGCGEGLQLVTASAFHFKKLIGVEFATELCVTARQNVPSALIVHLDAAQFVFPEDPLVVFLCNPFKPPVLKPVVKRLLESAKADPRPIYVIYLVPMYPEVFPMRPVTTGPGGSYRVYHFSDA